MGRKKDRVTEEKIQELSFNNLKDRLQAVVDRLNQLGKSLHIEHIRGWKNGIKFPILENSQKHTFYLR